MITSKISKNSIKFEQNVNNNKMNFKNGSKNQFFEKEKTENIFLDKSLEKADLKDIYKLLKKINQAIILNINSKNKKNYHNIKRSFSSEDKKDVNQKEHSNEFEEILYILKKPLIKENIKKEKSYIIPFKPLLKPKKISLVGKVIFNVPSEDSIKKLSLKKNDIKWNNKNLLIKGN